MHPLDRVLTNWNTDRTLFWADETLSSNAAEGAGMGGKDAPAAILIGPEGGFSDEEKAKLRKLDFVRPLRLGPRILRAETAAIAAIVQWQSSHGDWR